MRKQKLSTKLIIMFILANILVLAIQAMLNYSVSYRIIQEQVQLSSQKSLKNIQSAIMEDINYVVCEFNQIYYEEDFITNLKNDADVEWMKREYTLLAHDYYVDEMQSRQGLVSMYIYNTEHECISYYRHADTPKYKYPKDIYENSEKYNADRVKSFIASDEYRTMISGYYNENREINIVRLVHKIFINNRQEMIGYIVYDMDEKVFRNIMDKYTYSDEQVVYLQPGGDRVITGSGEIEETQEIYLEAVADEIEADRNWKVPKEKNGKVFYESQSKYNLIAYSVVPESIFANERQILMSYILLAAMAMAVICIISTIIMSNYLTTPLKELLVTIKRIREGEKDLRAPVISNDEIGELSHNFNEMVSQIDKLVSSEYELQLVKQRAEYKALQAQINPHFLYNTLDTMVAIARMQNCDEVRDMCMALSQMFRYSMDMKSTLTTIHRELAHLENYLFIMNVRMRDTIKVTLEIDDKYKGLAVPRLSLQPIVENAINHGLRNKRGEKEVSIFIQEKEEDIVIIFEDNGIGMDAEEINERLRSTKADALESGKSIGLLNINTRVQLIFGEEYGIKVESIIGEGSRVSMKIPKQKEILF